MYAICVYEAMKNKAIISNISIRGRKIYVQSTAYNQNQVIKYMQKI